MTTKVSIATITFAALLAPVVSLYAQQAPASAPPRATAAAGAPATAAPAAPAVPVVPPSDYVIGAGDVLTINYWRDKEMTTEAHVRPDGKIALPLLDEVHAAGLTPEQLDERLTEISKRLLEDPNITVVVKSINSRMVFVTGEVNKQGPLSLMGPMSVLHALTLAGGVTPYAKSKEILVIRGGKPIKFNYKEVIAGKKLQQNIDLLPGDQVVVP